MASAPGRQAYYIYDPHVGSDFGGLRVEENDKGKFVMTEARFAQYWIDQGLMGLKPVAELSGAGKELLKQITRGRSEDKDTKPKRVPKYNKKIMSGIPSMSGQLASPTEQLRRSRRKAAAEKKTPNPVSH